MVLTELDRT